MNHYIPRKLGSMIKNINYENFVNPIYYEKYVKLMNDKYPWIKIIKYNDTINFMNKYKYIFEHGFPKYFMTEKINNLRSIMEVCNDKFYIIPEEIGELIKLELLYISGIHLKVIPIEVTKLTNLKTLTINNANLKALPVEIGNMSLNTLHIDNNKTLRHKVFIPDVIGNMESITELRLSNCGLTEIPAFISKLHALEILNLNRNKITEIPKFVTKLNMLQTLDLNHNLIEEIPEDIGSMTSLRFLSLNHNKISKIPESILKLKSLQRLGLRDNLIDDIPNFIGKLQLINIDLTNNIIVKFPNNTSNKLRNMISIGEDDDVTDEEEE